MNSGVARHVTWGTASPERVSNTCHVSVSLSKPSLPLVSSPTALRSHSLSIVRDLIGAEISAHTGKTVPVIQLFS